MSEYGKIRSGGTSTGLFMVSETPKFVTLAFADSCPEGYLPVVKDEKPTPASGEVLWVSYEVSGSSLLKHYSCAPEQSVLPDSPTYDQLVNFVRRKLSLVFLLALPFVSLADFQSSLTNRYGSLGPDDVVVTNHEAVAALRSDVDSLETRVAAKRDLTNMVVTAASFGPWTGEAITESGYTITIENYRGTHTGWLCDLKTSDTENRFFVTKGSDYACWSSEEEARTATFGYCYHADTDSFMGIVTRAHTNAVTLATSADLAAATNGTATRAEVAAVSNALVAATNEVAATYLPLTGGTLSGDLNMDNYSSIRFLDSASLSFQVGYMFFNGASRYFFSYMGGDDDVSILVPDGTPVLTLAAATNALPTFAAVTNIVDGATNGLATRAEVAAATNLAAVAAAEAYLSVTGGIVKGNLEISGRVAQGNRVSATGRVSHAEGYSTTASGDYSHAEGRSTTASGKCSHADGYSTTASGNYSHAEGYETLASGALAHADGSTASATNENSYTWSGVDMYPGRYGSHGDGTFNINPAGGMAGFWIGETNLAGHLAAATNAAATKAEVAAVSNLTVAVSNEVATLFGYVNGELVRISITNYYGNTSGDPPRLRIEEAVTNAQGTIESWRIVWDELTRQTNYQAKIDARVTSLSNGLMSAAYRQTSVQLDNKAPRAWGEVTSAGLAAPPNTVWVTEPKLVLAGGTEYAHIAVGQGSVSILTANGQMPYTEGAEGQFRFCDDSGTNYFGFDVASGYTIGCRTAEIDPQLDTDGNYLITLTYDLVAPNYPTIYHSTNLTTWTQAAVTWWEQQPANQVKCSLNAGTAPCGFYKATITTSDSASFVTNMKADLAGGILATNEVNNVVQSIYPAITSTGVVWRTWK